MLAWDREFNVANCTLPVMNCSVLANNKMMESSECQGIKTANAKEHFHSIGKYRLNKLCFIQDDVNLISHKM